MLYQSSVYSIIWSRLPILTLTLPVISVVLRCWLKTVPLQPEPPTQGWKTQKSPITRRVFFVPVVWLYFRFFPFI
ncbi:hypothetical protein OT43_23685 [Salmonella enterica subsp. enterica serovar Typhimurium]|uniref:Uncharacterized protein n=9 Tax=Enterobacteriaceae TaxID=543 RepID=A0AAP8AJM7_ECOLX|nr:hypothetical protein CEP99_25775 [Salmonella enterica subsp. enterica serovar Typhimurium]ATB85495.1 hypothetical protein CNQ54_24450 [Escherichia coli]EAA0576703.1 hypothetical protein [Salmonella enterica]EAA2602140.1 hypothetical protein [Shigella flexneri]EAA4411181.1 hypothetical protein [Salmonella enterica subsp. enterica serovar Enteritidis]EAA4815323.1 hypothetical protein [Shigella boydii]EAA5564697.1 hypothetical protein [Salmonella enterica subsp. enterica]EAB8969621.1 hypothe